ncbi:MAG TPA: hypothetical protein VGR89_09265 [Puia sp.]|nr:hypothetical protein [Puia sp.]
MKKIISGGPSAPAHDMHWTLRVAAAMCFLGHGSFGILTKPIWCNYFGVFGIGHAMAYHLMPVVGVVDIAMGISLLLYPTRAIAGWLIVWGFTTALLRPLSGEPVAEFIERAGNFGAPLTLLILSGRGAWWSAIGPWPQPDERCLARVTGCLRVIITLLLLGHGWLNWSEKGSLLAQYSALGFSDPVATAHTVGIFEMLAALSVLLRPVRSLILVLFLWKMATELFYPRHELFEFIERGGSYGCLLALWLALEDRGFHVISNKTLQTTKPATV